MTPWPKRILTGLGFVAFLGTFLTMVGGTPAGATTTVPVQRIYGIDAIGTSIVVSEAEFPAAGSAKAVVLARSDFFADALAGGPLAAKLGGPLLITPGASLSTTLDPRVQAEIQRVLPVGDTVYILGGDLALSPNIDTQLQALGYVTQRIAGADEYGTAVDIAEAEGNPTTIFEATGLSFQDALSAVPAAIKEHGAILLTDGTTQAPETAAYLAANPGDTRYAIGGPLAAYGADPTATPVYGQDLYETSAAVASTFFPSATVFGAATGTNFPDALSGGVFMGEPGTQGPMLLVEPFGPLPPTIDSYLSGVASELTQGYLFGGPVAVSDDVLSELSVGFAPTDEQEAMASYESLQESLYEASVQLYQGLPSSSCDPYSCLWPFTNAMAGTEYLDASPGRSSYAPDVAARLNGLLAYVDPDEVSPSGGAQPRAFESAVAPPEGPGGSTYYDDNAWSALDLIDAYRLTGNPTDLTLAQDTFNFVLTGWDTSQTDGCPGGVFWEDVSGSQRNTTANAGNAEVGLELYQLTENSADLTWAEQMYQWVNTCLESPYGLYYDHVNPGGSVDTTMWSYNQGTMIGAGALLYEITGIQTYLTAAEDTAAAAVSYFGTGTTLQDQGPAFNAIYFRDLFVLGQIQPNTTYTAEAQAYATYMWTQRDTSSGLFLQNGQTNGVNGTAPMVEIYSLLAGSTPRP